MGLLLPVDLFASAVCIQDWGSRRKWIEKEETAVERKGFERHGSSARWQKKFKIMAAMSEEKWSKRPRHRNKK